MTTTATDRPASILRRLTTTATHEDRRKALIELADLVDTERRYPSSQPLTPVLDLVVPTLAAHTVEPDRAVELFESLCATVGERHRFLSKGTGSASLDEAVETRLLADVDSWADALLGKDETAVCAGPRCDADVPVDGDGHCTPDCATDSFHAFGDSEAQR